MLGEMFTNYRSIDAERSIDRKPRYRSGAHDNAAHCRRALCPLRVTTRQALLLLLFRRNDLLASSFPDVKSTLTTHKQALGCLQLFPLSSTTMTFDKFPDKSERAPSRNGRSDSRHGFEAL